MSEQLKDHRQRRYGQVATRSVRRVLTSSERVPIDAYYVSPLFEAERTKRRVRRDRAETRDLREHIHINSDCRQQVQWDPERRIAGISGCRIGPYKNKDRCPRFLDQ